MLASIFMTDIVLFQKMSTNSFLSSRSKKQVRLLVVRNKTKFVRSFLFDLCCCLCYCFSFICCEVRGNDVLP